MNTVEENIYSVHDSHTRIIPSKDKVKGKIVVDTHGFRNSNAKQKLFNLKDDDFFNIIFFGGSTMFGALVNDNETIPYHFESILYNKLDYSKTNVINFGQPGYNFRENVILLQNILIDGYKPDLVIFYNGINESSKLKELISRGIEKKWEYNETGNDKIKYAYDNFYNKNKILNFHKLPIVIFLKNTFAHISSFLNYRIYKKEVPILSLDFIDSYSEDSSNNYFNSFKALDGLSLNYEFNTIVFLQPTRAQYTEKKECWIKRKDGSSRFYFTQNEIIRKNFERTDTFYIKVYDKIIKRISTYQNKIINFYDASNIFLTHDCIKGPVFIDQIAHLNNLGNNIIAEMIFNNNYVQNKLK